MGGGAVSKTVLVLACAGLGILIVVNTLADDARRDDARAGVWGDSSRASGTLHPIEIRNPPTLGTVDTGLRDASGAYIGVACETCHAPDRAGALARDVDGKVPADFHAGIEVVHGDLSCQSCHDPDDRTRLRLADGRKLEIAEVLTLCGQCHGPQLRNFRNGVHGGGRGYWDRSRGPWIRNNCVSCHSAHAPAYPLVMPAPPPNDRFVPRPHDSAKEEPHG